MHIYVLIRGIQHQVDQFKIGVQGMYLPTKRKIKKGKKWVEENIMVQVGYRPIELAEIVFPKEHKDLMLNTLLDKKHGVTQHKRHRKWVAVIRRILGVDKIDWNYKDNQIMPINKGGIEIVGIGTKEDREIDGEKMKIEGL